MLASSETANQKWYQNSTITKYILFPMIPLTIVGLWSVPYPNAFFLDGINHFYFEIFAVIFDGIIAIYCISRYRVTEDRFFLFLGLGFIASASIDFLHALVSITYAGQTSFLAYFIPQTWAAGRIIDAATLIIAFVMYVPRLIENKMITQEKKQSILVPIITMFAIVGSSIGFSMLAPLPSVLLDGPLFRPYDVLAVGAFATVLFFYFKKGYYKINDIFFKGLAGYVVISLFAEGIIAMSATNFDSPFNVAHILKDIGYMLIIIVLSKSFQQQFKMKVEMGHEIEKQTDELEKFKYALDESAIVAITDNKGTITYVNDKFCDISKYTKEELIGNKILKFDEHPPEFADNIWKTISSGKVWRGDVKNIAKDGTNYWAKTVITPLIGKNEKPERYIIIRTDITEQKWIEDVLSLQAIELSNALKRNKKVEKLKEEFLAMISHELKTPLTPITLWAGALKNENILGKLTTDQLDAITTISDSADELTKLVSDIFDSYKLDLENMSFSSEEIKIDEMMNEAVEQAEQILLHKEITFKNTTLSIGTMYSDYKRILQVMKNIIINAIDFVDPNNGKIEINASIKKNSVLFQVKDNSVGISTEDQKNLFQKFYQVDTSTTRKHGGSGLGLSICKGLVTGMKGKIWVESKVGKGSIFYFTIPVGKPKDDTEVHLKSTSTPKISN